MKQNFKKAFTLVEILVVLVIMGLLVSMVLPKFQDSIKLTQQKLNKSQMLAIKKASLEFYNDVGFVADNVTLLTYPWEKCEVDATNYDKDNTDVCINMIAFIDRHYKFTQSNPKLRTDGIGDNGYGTKREDVLIKIIKEKLDPNKGWKGGYIGGNEIIKEKNLKKLGTSTNESENLYFFTQKDIDIYYEGFQSNRTLNEIDSIWDENSANKKLYPVFSQDFNGSRHSSGTSTTIIMDSLYENGKYSKDEIDNGAYDRKTTFIGAMTILDPYGTPYEIQIVTKSGVEAYNATNPNSSKVRTKYARIVSFGKNRRRDTPIDVVDIKAYLNQAGNEKLKRDYDDSVLYIFSGHGLENYFHTEDEN